VGVRFETIAGIIIGMTAGLVIGLGGYTFLYARGASYLTDNPAACANCHIMQEQYDGWIKASHRAAAVCNDCHTPPVS
jgi:cytochrome c nitrite reductase small subunit